MKIHIQNTHTHTLTHIPTHKMSIRMFNEKMLVLNIWKLRLGGGSTATLDIVHQNV